MERDSLAGIADDLLVLLLLLLSCVMYPPPLVRVRTSSLLSASFNMTKQILNLLSLQSVVFVFLLHFCRQYSARVFSIVRVCIDVKET